jgi:YqjK-like protein
VIRNQLIALGARRSRLAADAQSEREAIARAIAPADGAASVVASLLAVARRAAGEARQRPELVVAGVALLVALRPRRALAWIARGWSLWRLYRGAQRWWSRFDALTGAPAVPRR